MVTSCIKRLLGGFHNRVVQHISENIHLLRAKRAWEYPNLGDAIREAGLKEIKTYISRQHNTVAQ